MLLVATALAAHAQDATGASDDDMADILEALEADAGEQEAPPPPPAAPTQRPAATLMNPDISFIADVALAAFSSDEASQGGAHDPSVRGFNLQQLEMAIGGAADPYFRLDGNIVFSEFGVEIEEVYATSLAFPARLQVRTGQFLTRFGRANATHPHTWDFVDQPLMLGRLMGGEGNRGLGAEVSWLTPLPWFVELTASSTNARGAATNKSFYGATDLGVRGPLDLQTTLTADQFFPLGDDVSLLWGLSYALGPNPTGPNLTELYGTDIYLKYRPITRGSFAEVTLVTEWTWRQYQIPGDALRDLTGLSALTWRFARRWGVAGRHEYGSPTTTSGGIEVPDPVDPSWAGFRQRLSANVTFWPTEFTRVRLQGSQDVLDWIPDPVYAGFLAFEFNIGAHGAHAF